MRIPAATYRLQFNPSFGFKDAQRIIPYLAELGITCVYASPIFKARRGSTHGYDVADTNQLNPELGSQGDFDALIETVHGHGMTWLQDFVPNHMAYDSANLMLMDIFEKGRASRYFSFFDIDWEHMRENLRGKVIAPFLGKPYGETLESGELRLECEAGRFAIRYYETLYPLSIKSYGFIIAHQLDKLKERLGAEHPGFVKTLGIAAILNSLSFDLDGGDAEARNAQLVLAQDALSELYRNDAEIRDYIDESVVAFNRDVDLLHELLLQQWFQLTYWRVATKEINYQRFFNINELISLRMEDERVFEFIHRLALRLLREGKINGLRIDHVDGLYNPTEYLARLKREAGDAFIVVEKILELSEHLPRAWRVEGTTGYDFLNWVNGLFVDSRNGERLQKIYERFGGEATPYADLLYEKKKLIIERHLTGDLDNLTSLLKNISATTREAIDLAWEALNGAIAETAAVFPVYRTYIAGGEIEERDRAYIEDAIEKAKARNPLLSRALDFLQSVLTLDYPDYLEEDDKRMWLRFVMRFQQFTSPLMAKGLEDTTFYVYNRLVSLNEVGGDPARFGVTVDEFHSFNQKRLKPHPHAMNATATHDTKRGEDVRARINVLSEIPDEWERVIQEWQAMNRRFKKIVNDEEAPDANREYFLYQTLVGAYPFDEGEREGFAARIKEYIIKSAREAKTHTFWLDNNTEYESALIEFTEAVLASDEFLESFIPFQQMVAHYGVFNSLSQVLLKITSPGLPDFYQGSELWDLNLVDPDNRRAVDYAKREALLGEIREKEESCVKNLIDELLRTKEDGRIKMFTIRRAIAARNRDKELFDAGEYIPLKATGKRSENVVAFARRLGERWSVTIAPRLVASVVKMSEHPFGKDVWEETSVEIPAGGPGAWRNDFTGEAIESGQRVYLADALRRFPVALLSGEVKL